MAVDVASPKADTYSSAAEASIFKNKAHDGPVRGLDFNPIAKNLLASGATNGQVTAFRKRPI